MRTDRQGESLAGFLVGRGVVPGRREAMVRWEGCDGIWNERLVGFTLRGMGGFQVVWRWRRWLQVIVYEWIVMEGGRVRGRRVG